MSANSRRATDPVQMLEIGTIIEVTGSEIVVELDSRISELSRVYLGEIYDIGQFGSVIKIHFGRRLIYAMVRSLRMKAEYEAEHGMTVTSSTDERVIEADLIRRRRASSRSE